MAKKSDGAKREGSPKWNFLSNHAFVVICIAQDSEVRLRDVAAKVGITERAVQRIIADLEAGGFLSRNREGRRNRYDLHPEVRLNHPMGEKGSLADILSLFSKRSRSASEKSGKRPTKKKVAKKRSPKKM
jgi:hypothetical protein